MNLRVVNKFALSLGMLVLAWSVSLPYSLRGVAAKTLTNADVEALKHPTQSSSTSQRLEDARFPMAVMSEAWSPPAIVQRLLPYTEWLEEYQQYFVRHCGNPTLTLEPRILVMHYTASSRFDAAYNTFVRGVRMSAGDQGTVFGHPSVHYMIDTDGQIYQLMPENRRATGTYGVNHCALQVELVAPNEAALVNNAALLASSFRLARWLTRRYQVSLAKVYGHYEVSEGQSVVPEYLDYADASYPTSYPPSSARTDPGTTYMAWLRYYLKYRP